MSEGKIENTGTILKQITAAEGTGVIEILDSRSLYSPYDGLTTAWYVGRKLQIEDLQLTVNLSSFSEAPIPDIAPEDTAAERQLKMNAIESAYPSLGLAIYRSVNNQPWVRQALPKMQNFGSERYLPLLQPYMAITEVKLLGENEKLGVQVVDLGGGTLGPIDYITVNGSWSQTISLVAKEAGTIASTIAFSRDLRQGIVSQVVPTRRGRRSLTIQNFGNSRVWFLPTDSSSSVRIGASLFLEPGGASHTSFEGWILDKPVWAIAEGDTRLVGYEGVA